MTVSTTHRKTGEFILRNSLLTDLFQISHINCVRNAFAAGFIIMITKQIIYDLVRYGRFNWTFELLFLVVGQLHVVLIVWLWMQVASSICVFYAINTWANNRKYVQKNLKFYDLFWLCVYIFYLMALLTLPCWQIVKYQLPYASSALILGEQLRLMMKIHSFVRETVQKCLPLSTNSNDYQQISIQLKHYIYFLFAPTLIYRDTYPRTSIIQWDFVWKMFGQFFLSLCFVYHLVAYYWLPVFQQFFTHYNLTAEMTLLLIYELMLPGVLIILLVFYGFFHCWLNGFAELLRFADRKFYEDWWNFTSAATFWRSWNIVVHDWLYIYVYKDLNRVFHGNKKLSTLCVVIISAIFHEYVMIFTLKYFSPILLGWFAVFGMLFRFAFPKAKGAQWNILLLAFIPICSGLIPYLYVLEATSRFHLMKNVN